MEWIKGRNEQKETEVKLIKKKIKENEIRSAGKERK